jgi:hypothetical protein
LLDLGAEWRNARWPRLIAHQVGDTIRHEAFLPAPHCRLAGVGAAHDFRRAATIRGEQGRSSVFNSTVNPVRMRGTRTHRTAGAVPNRTQLLGFIH